MSTPASMILEIVKATAGLVVLLWLALLIVTVWL